MRILILISTLTGVLSVGMLGGWTEQDPSNPEYMSKLRSLEVEHNLLTFPKKSLKLTGVSTQIVSGVNYKFTFTIGAKSCEIVYYEQVWTNTHQITRDTCDLQKLSKNHKQKIGQKSKMVGGWEPIADYASPGVQECVGQALDQVTAQKNSYFRSAETDVKGVQQVVAGMKYKLQMSVTDSSCINDPKNLGLTAQHCPVSSNPPSTEKWVTVCVYQPWQTQDKTKVLMVNKMTDAEIDNTQTNPTKSNSKIDKAQKADGKTVNIVSDTTPKKPLLGQDGHDQTHHGRKLFSLNPSYVVSAVDELLGDKAEFLEQGKQLIGGNDAHDMIKHGEQMLGIDGHDLIEHGKKLLGGDGHDLLEHAKSLIGGNDAHDLVKHGQELLGGDGHDLKQHIQKMLGGDDHDKVPHSNLIGGDDHDKVPHGNLLGGDDHDKVPHGNLLGGDDHDKVPHGNLLGGDDHDKVPHGNLLGGDDHDKVPHGNFIGGDDHDKVPHGNLIGGDDHDKVPHGNLIGGDDHDKVPHGNLLGGDDHDKVPHGNLLGGVGHSMVQHILRQGSGKVNKTKLLGGDGHDDCHMGMFQEFKSKYNKLYGGTKEEQKRFLTFCDNMRMARKLQETDRGSAKYGATKFADLTKEEFRQYVGKRWDQNANIWMKQADIPKGSIPDQFDWRDHGAVTPVKNQGSCGSCWAFSTTGNIEGQWAIKKKELISLSEQELVDCDKLDEGCNGGLPSNAYKEIERLGGLETEDEYKYKGEDEKCNFIKSDVKVYINDSVSISKNETDMAAWLSQNGPISIGINAFAMQFYMGGISHPWKIFCNPADLDHGVLIVGYGNKGSEPYWIVKNSWGENWGEQGYYLVYRGAGVCGLNTMCTSAVVN